MVLEMDSSGNVTWDPYVGENASRMWDKYKANWDGAEATILALTDLREPQEFYIGRDKSDDVALRFRAAPGHGLQIYNGDGQNLVNLNHAEGVDWPEIVDVAIAQLLEISQQETGREH